MDKTTSQILPLLPTSQQQEILEKAVKGLQEKVRVIVSNLPAEKLIMAHEYLTTLVKEQPPNKQRPPPSYVTTPEESDGEYNDMPPLIDEIPKRVVKNIYGHKPLFT